MNIQEYISSGIVESYVLGLASNEERIEFEQLSASHAELRAAREAFEINLEQQALGNAMPAPAAVKEKIWSELDLKTAAPPIGKNAPVAVTMQPLTPVRTLSIAKLMAAASIILLLGSTLLNVYYYNQYKTSLAQLQDLIASNQETAKNTTIMQTKIDLYEKSLDLVKDSNMAIIALKGQPVAPQSLTTVYWNKQTKDVYLLVNNLPVPVTGKQYQLWAIVDGVPVDAGTLNMNEANGLVKMKNIPKAQAFAITLELAGGSKTPTMPIYVVGKA